MKSSSFKTRLAARASKGTQGYHTLTYRGYMLGYCKSVGGGLTPKGLTWVQGYCVCIPPSIEIVIFNLVNLKMDHSKLEIFTRVQVWIEHNLYNYTHLTNHLTSSLWYPCTYIPSIPCEIASVNTLLAITADYEVQVWIYAPKCFCLFA